MRAPEGFRTIETSHALAWVRSDARAWVEAALGRGTLFAAAHEEPDRLLLQGRGPVYAVPASRGRPGPTPDTREEHRWVVRHYVRGGTLGPLWGDRYPRMGTPRPFHELLTSERVRGLGIPTPRVVAAAVYPSPLIYRGDLVTDYLPHTVDLAEALFGPGSAHLSGAVDRREALRASGALLRQMAAAGVHHVDLNAKNILLQWEGALPRAFVLDLDRARIRQDSDLAEPMLKRLTRSLHKLERRHGLTVPASELGLLERAVRGP